MSIDGLIVLFIAVGLMFFVGSPLMRQRLDNSSGGEPTRELEQLTLHKETVYTAIRDLDFDFQTDKVDDDDYRALRRHLEDEAVDVLRRIDAVDPLAALDDEIERQILTIRQQQNANLDQTVPDVCSVCHAGLQGGEKFCPSCGQSLTLL
ncbi:MAG: zinc ribbon domain-containing protein [bacterium]|nr:zinc ribbon domain-containing protein [bacterium]